MPTEQGDSRFAQLVESPGEDLVKDGTLGLFRKGRDGQRRKRPASHRVYVAEGIRRGDLPVGKRVVDDRGEEIHCLHEGMRSIQPVHTGIVRGPIVNEDPVVVVHGQVAQYLGELTCGELARSTGAGGVIRQSSFHSLTSLGRAPLAFPTSLRARGRLRRLPSGARLRPQALRYFARSGPFGIPHLPPSLARPH